MNKLSVVFSLALLTTGICLAQKPSTRHDNSNPPDNQASLEAFQVPSHGAVLNAFEYRASGPGSHPTLILLHGFPGNERNLDIAQSARRVGWNVVYFDYRGSWGSTGVFSFSHCIEDTAATIAYLRSDANAERLHIDPLSLVLLGHSVGGLFALQATANDPLIKAVLTVSAVDFNGFMYQFPRGSSPEELSKGIAQQFESQGMGPLAGTTADALAGEVLQNMPAWGFSGVAPKIKGRLRLVVTSNDGLAQMSDALVLDLHKDGLTIPTVKLATDHNYSDRRLELQDAVVHALSEIGGK